MNFGSLLFSKENSGRLGFHEFCYACRARAFRGGTVGGWMAYNMDSNMGSSKHKKNTKKTNKITLWKVNEMKWNEIEWNGMNELNEWTNEQNKWTN